MAGGDRVGVGVRKYFPSRRGVTPDIFFNAKSCILMHSLAQNIGTASVFIETPKHGYEDCWERLPNEAENRGRRSRAGVGFLGREPQAPHQQLDGLGSTVSSPSGVWGGAPTVQIVFYYFPPPGWAPLTL